MSKCVLSLLLLCLSPWGLAQTAPATTQLDAHASQEVENDELAVSLSASRDGPSPSDITQAVLAKLNAAVAQARQVERVQIQVGNVQTTPVWGPKGKTGQWTARAELHLVSTNTQGLGRLASELTSLMQIDGMNFRLSKDKRLATEKALIKDMATNFKDRASSISQAFGFRNYSIKELNFAPRPERNFSPMPRAMARSMAPDMAVMDIPNEAGKSTVSISMDASITLLP